MLFASCYDAMIVFMSFMVIAISNGCTEFSRQFPVKFFPATFFPTVIFSRYIYSPEICMHILHLFSRKQKQRVSLRQMERKKKFTGKYVSGKNLPGDKIAREKKSRIATKMTRTRL